MEGSTNNLADPFLLETIDKLFEHNIGDSVSLPQVSLSSCHNFKKDGLRPYIAPRRWRSVQVSGFDLRQITVTYRLAVGRALYLRA